MCQADEVCSPHLGVLQNNDAPVDTDDLTLPGAIGLAVPLDPNPLVPGLGSAF